MATIRNPQQVGDTSCEDARIGRGARDMESHHAVCVFAAGQIPFCRKARIGQRAEVLPTTGGCLNPPEEVPLAERETHPSLRPSKDGTLG